MLVVLQACNEHNKSHTIEPMGNELYVIMGYYHQISLFMSSKGKKFPLTSSYITYNFLLYLHYFYLFMPSLAYPPLISCYSLDLSCKPYSYDL